MRNLLIATLAGAGLLLAGSMANAQIPQPYHTTPEQMRKVRQADPSFGNPHYYQERHAAEVRNAMFDRIRADLDIAHARTQFFSPDRDRVDRAIQEVSACQSAMDDGHYSQRQLADAISSVDRVANQYGFNFMTVQTRDRLVNDAAQLQGLQTNMQLAYQSH